MLKLLAMLAWSLLEESARRPKRHERCACQELAEENEMLWQRIKTLDELNGFYRAAHDKRLREAMRHERN